VRIDGLIETNMPDARAGFVSLESPTHGNVLWVSLDHGRTRVGFALSAALLEKYGEHLTQEEIIEEAKAAVKPFSLEFTSVDWYSVYAVRHAVADTFIKGRVILAGDACHAHSSGTAQGMNTGVHDAVNLAWKLAGVLKKWYDPAVLPTYNNERRPIAEQVIQLDKAFSAVISGKIPPELAGSSTDPHALFSKLVDDNIRFTTGLGIGYPPNLLNMPTTAGMLPCGCRPPDALVYAPGASMRVPTRLQTIMKNVGAFWVVVFAAEPLLTGSKLATLRAYFDSPAASGFANPGPMKDEAKWETPRVKFLTLITGNRPQADEALGVPRFGDVYYDPDSSAHARYGVSSGSGAVVVFRPDGILGFAAPLDAGERVGEYFSRFFVKDRGGLGKDSRL
jgi:phenol 2-monooxygenase (NADPH)